MSRYRLLLAALLLSGCGTDNNALSITPDPQQPPVQQQVEEFGTGYDEAPQSVRDTYPRALPVEVREPQATGLTIAAATASPSPPAVVNISCPPVQNQGHTGGCVSFATGYELISTAAGAGRDLTDLSQCSSSAWGYLNALNLEGKKCEVGPSGSTSGTLAASYLDTAVNVGAVSYAAIPFPSPSPIAVQVRELNAINATRSSFPPSTQFQLGHWSVVNNSVEQLKANLAAGHPMSIGINVPHGLSAYKGGIFAPSPQPSPGGGHNVFLKGYDDTKGAFIIQNSWGTGWGEQGNIYWAYDSLPHFLRPDGVHMAVPVSTEASSDGAGPLEVVRAHQGQAHDGSVHLVPLVRLTPALRVERYTIVSPSGRRATVTGGFILRSGHLYLSRHDGLQWPAGVYTLVVNDLSARFTLRALPGLSTGDTPADVRGSNRLPVVVN